MLGFFDALRKYATFSGRARRREYWGFVVTAWLIEVFLGTLTLVTVNDAIDYDTQTIDVDQLGALGWVMIAVTAAVVILLVVPMWAVSVRRLHDGGNSGAWALFLLVFPVVVWIMALFDGQPTANAYGPDPKGRGADVPPAAALG